MSYLILGDDPPQDEQEAVTLLRRELTRVAYDLSNILEEGFPKKGRNRDERDSWLGWHEDRRITLMRAKRALKTTEEFDANPNALRKIHGS